MNRFHDRIADLESLSPAVALVVDDTRQAVFGLADTLRRVGGPATAKGDLNVERQR